MPNEYSVEIHTYVSQKISEAEKAIQQRDGFSPCHQGQLDEFLWIRKYLTDHIDLKDFTYY